MSIENGIVYINNARENIQSSITNKGVDTVGSVMSDFPHFIDKQLENTKWVYPSDWVALSDKDTDNVDHIAELVVFDDETPIRFYIEGVGNGTIRVKGLDGGTFILDNETKSTNTDYTITSGTHVIQMKRGTGFDSNDRLFTTLKVTVKFTTALRNFHFNNEDLDFELKFPVLAIQMIDTTPYNKVFYISEGDETEGFNNCSYYFPYLRYIDVSSTNNLSSRAFQFSSARGLAKIELPNGFIAANYAFANDSSLREIEGLDTDTPYNRIGVFQKCDSYTPQSFNYQGNNCYFSCNLNGKSIILPSNMTKYPDVGFICSYTVTRKAHTNNSIGDYYSLYIPDTVTTFGTESLNALQNVILRLPSCHATVKGNIDEYSSPFIGNPYKIENGENFYIDKPVIISVNYFADSVLNLPHVPLVYFDGSAYNTGKLTKLIFDWENSELIDSPEGYCINIGHQNFNHANLIDLFTILPETARQKHINISGNPGVDELTDAEIDALSNKGYIIVS